MTRSVLCPQCKRPHFKGERFCIVDGHELPGPEDPSATHTTPASPHLGRVIAGRCEILRPLGSGGMSEVFLGFHRALLCDVAVKLLTESRHSDSALSVKRFLREAMAVARLEHDNIVRILDFGLDRRAGDPAAPEDPFLIMELLEGVPLHRHLNAAEQRRLPLGEAVELLRQLMDALDHAHGHNVVHRDIKLENLMLSEDDDGAPRLKLLDFGIARLLDLVPDTPVADLMGTPTYMAPELWQSPGEVTPAVDLYAAGVLAYELLTGSPPFLGPPEDPHAVAPLFLAHVNKAPPPLRVRRSDIPAELESLALSLLAKDRRQRPSAREARQRLQEIATGLAPLTGRIYYIDAEELVEDEVSAVDPAQTVLLQRSGAPRSSEGTVAMLSRVKSTVIAPFRLRQIEQLDSDIDQLYGRLREQVETVVAAVGHRPASVEKLLGSMRDLEEEEDVLGEQLALQQSRARDGAALVAQRQRLLRQEMLTLTEQRNGCGDPRRAAELQLAYDHASRAYAGAAASVDNGLQEAIALTRQLRQQQRDAARRVLLSLAAALQVQTALPGQVAALRDLRRMATALEAKLAELFVLLKGLRRG